MPNPSPRALHPATASSYLANLLLHYGAQVGVEPAEICATAGLAPETLSDPAARVPPQTFNALWQAVAHRSGDPDFGLHLAEAADQMAGGSLLLAVLMNCATVGDALEKLARYHGLTTDMVYLRVAPHGRDVACRLEAASGISLQRHALEAMVGSLAGTLRRLTRDQAVFSAVHFSHAAPVSTTAHQRFFGCPVHFGQARTELRFSREVLTWPVALANAQLLEKLEQVAQAMLSQAAAPNPWANRVTHQISQKLLRGEKPDLEAVASALALGPRQLQNRLRAEGVTFQRLLDDLRRDAALRYLQDGALPLCDIAFLLGFTEQSAFNHAFKRWTGSRPRDYQHPAQ
jgi:AraC-like DNA-binding protein